MVIRSWRRQRERGAVAILVTLVLATGVLLGTAGLVVDVGNLYAERGQLQNGADAAALAIADACATGGCADTTDVEAQWATARKYANANAKDGHTYVKEVCGNWGLLDACTAPANNLSACIGNPPAQNYVEVRVRTEMPDGSALFPPTFAAAMAGNSSYKGTSVATCSRATASAVCVTADKETYTHNFDGASGKATVVAAKPLCPGERVPVTLVAYTAPAAASIFPQYVYDQDVQAFTSTTPKLTLDFGVDLPNCFTQVDLAFRDGAINPLLDADYGDTKLGSSGPPGNQSTGPGGWFHGTGPDCDPRPAVAMTSNCDGTLSVKLSNGSGTNVDAVFTVTSGGTDQWVHVQAGKSTTVTIAKSDAASVSVFDNSGKTTTGGRDSAGCC